MASLTGRTRYRAGWFGRLILQVEVDVTGSPWVSQMDPGLHTKWRDARVDDLARVASTQLTKEAT